MVDKLAEISITGAPLSEDTLRTVRLRLPQTNLAKHGPSEHRYVYGLSGGGTTRVRLRPNAKDVATIEYLGDVHINKLFYPFAAQLVTILISPHPHGYELMIHNRQGELLEIEPTEFPHIEDILRRHCG